MSSAMSTTHSYRAYDPQLVKGTDLSLRLTLLPAGRFMVLFVLRYAKWQLSHSLISSVACLLNYLVAEKLNNFSKGF